MLRVIGDVHGKVEDYLDLISAAPHSVQLGDMGFDYSLLGPVDPTCHKVIPGNHENYPLLRQNPLFLGNFGEKRLGNTLFWWFRGAFSIDFAGRTPGWDWFPDEEVPPSQCDRALEHYSSAKPDLVLSHDGPEEALAAMYPGGVMRTRTSWFLSELLRQHQPKLWIFGHHHQTRRFYADRCSTLFLCLDELAYVDLTIDKKGLFMTEPRRK